MFNLRKIVFLLQNLEGGGAERMALNLINNLSLKYYTLEVILLENRGVFIDQIVKRKGVKVTILSVKYKNRIINFLINFIIALKKLRNESIEIIFSQYNPGKALPFFKFFFKNKTLIYRETNIPKFETKDSKFYIKIINRMFYLYGIKKYDKIILQSQDMQNEILQVNSRLCKEKLFLVHNFIDFENISKNLTTQIFTQKNKIKLISVGRLSKQKGYDLLLRTLYKINRKDIELKIYGEGEERKKLERLIRKYKLENVVELKGFKKNPYNDIAQADFFISSSRYEGFPNAVLESCVCGTPVIANRYLGGINEIIIMSLNGEIIDITDTTAFENALLKIYDRKKIRVDVLNRFGKNIIIKKYENIFFN